MRLQSRIGLYQSIVHTHVGLPGPAKNTRGRLSLVAAADFLLLSSSFFGGRLPLVPAGSGHRPAARDQPKFRAVQCSLERFKTAEPQFELL
jgi:hypothetical protein